MNRSHSPTNRRDFLQDAAMTLAAGTATAVLSAATNVAGKDEAPQMAGYIDAHSHIWTRDVAKFPLANRQTVNDLKPPSFTDEELLKTAEPAGVTRAVLIQHHIYHGWDNSYLIDAARRRPQTFRVVGMVDDTQPHPDVVMRKLLADRVTGFRITPRIRMEKWLEGPGMAAMWKCAAETRQAMCCLIDPAHLTGVAAMCQHYPDTVVVIDHFARIGADGMIRDEEVQQLCGLAKFKNTNVKVSAYYALGKKQPPYMDLAPMIRRLYDAFGPQRLMWASDSPYQVVEGHNYRDSIALIRDRLDFLSAEDKSWLLRRTAERVYFGA